MKTLPLLCLISFGVIAASGAVVDRDLQLRYEQADSPEGPWRSVGALEQVRQADGSVVLPSVGKKFFRLQIEQQATSSPLTTIRLGELPAQTGTQLTTRISELSRFLRPLAITRGTDTNDSISEVVADFAGVAAWRNITFASNAIPIYDPGYKGGAEPAYLEIKVLEASEARKSSLEGSSREVPANRGSILMSLGDHDVGIPFFSTDGETPAERLVGKLGLVDAAGRRILTPPPGHKIMRFSPVFHVLEGPTGEAVASLGTQPFKIPSNFLTVVPETQRAGGSDDQDPASNIPLGARAGFRPYASYQELKSDFLTNPVYQELRRRRALRNRVEQQIEAGTIPAAPESVRLLLGGTTTLLSGIAIDSYFLDDDDADLGVADFVGITKLRGGGLRLSGDRLGNGELTVKAGGRVYRFDVSVLRIILPTLQDTFTPGWQDPQIWDAGGYDEQPRYWQEKRDRWCASVGCGPVAWAILLAWWDRHNVPSAFAVGTGSALRTSLRNLDAPFYLDADDDPSGYNRVIKLYDILHDSCDVICDPFSDSGATDPDDMVEAWREPTKYGRRTSANGTYFPYPAPIPSDACMAYSYSWSWDLMDPDWNEPSSVIRKANKKGRPAIIGLGWLWHYGVSYAYRYQEYKATANGPALKVRRWFRVNEGWGKDNGEWYSGDDTFLGFDLKLKQKHLPPP